MQPKPILLNPNAHENLRLSPKDTFYFASRQMIIPIVFSEMADAAREYPIVFLKNKPAIAALVGFEQTTNAYVSPEGKWLANYIPGRVRAYPFLLAQNPDNHEKYSVAVDMASDFIGTEQGEPLFVMGKPTTTLNGYMKLLEDMQKAEPVTRHMVKAIRDAGLLMERAIKVRKSDQQDHQLTGIEFVDEKKLNKIPHEAFNNLRETGVLPLIYAHLLSLANLRLGVLKGQMPVMSEKTDIGSAIFGNDDIIRFE